MMKNTTKDKLSRRNERGSALIEFTIGATVFITATFGVVEMGRLLWVHNQLRDATRRGARLAVVRRDDATSIDAVKKMVVYGNPNANPASAKPVVPGLTMSNVTVEHKNFNGIRLSARATVGITNFQFKFVVPLVGGTINMPKYYSAMPGESAGFIPCDIPSGTPSASCAIIPN